MKIDKKTGEIIEPKLAKRPRVYAQLDYKTSRVQKHFKEECDINRIMKRFLQTGHLPELIKRDARYGDFTDAPTFQEALHTVIHANEQFAALPAKLRQQLGNDPAEFLKFVADPENKAELIKLGLAQEEVLPPPPEPQKVIIVNPDASKEN